jgi:hypothetical protein
MGVGASRNRGESGDVARPLLGPGGDGGNPPSREQAGLGDGVQALPPYGTFFEIPEPQFATTPSRKIPVPPTHKVPEPRITNFPG